MKTVELKNSGISTWPHRTFVRSIHYQIKGDNTLINELHTGKSSKSVLMIRSNNKAGRYEMPWQVCYNDDKNDL